MKIALLISGNGTTAEKIIIAARSGLLKNVEPALVISSKEESAGIERAAKAGVPRNDILVLKPADFGSPDAFGKAIISECQKRNIEFVGQYGWMPKTPSNVIEKFKGMLINQHSGPLDPGRPDFGGTGMYGKRIHAARLYFVRETKRDYWTEAVAQRVGLEFDEGAVVKARRVPILPDDDPVILQERVFPVEYEVQIEALQDFADGKAEEIKREEPLIRQDEEKILEEAKKAAKLLYPNG